jgi:hypothetical protein
LRSIYSFWWWPTGYYGNVFRTTDAFRLCAAVLTVVSSLGCILVIRNYITSRPSPVTAREQAALFLSIQAVASFSLFAISKVTVDGSLESRTTFPVLVVIGLLIVGGGTVVNDRFLPRFRLAFVSTTTIFLLVLCAFDIYQNAQLPGSLYPPI